MGLYASKLFQLYLSWGKQPSRILMLGLDAAGKTTILYKIKLNELVTTVPTIGFNVETVEVANGLTFTVWDIGAQRNMRRLWQHYLHGCQGLIYVVDSNDPERLNEAYEELNSLVTDEILREVPVLLLVSKQDLPSSSSVSEVTDKMRMHSLGDRAWHVQGCCAVTGEGLAEGMTDFSMMVRSFQQSKPPNNR